MGAGLREIGKDEGTREVCTTSDLGKGEGHRENRVEGVLPMELTEKILSFLPPACIFKFRSVCKQWNTTLCSSAFLKTCSQEPLDRPLLCIFTDDWNQKVAAYNYKSGKWFKFSLKFVPHLSDVNASTGSLVLCENYVRRDDGFTDSGYVICNPATKALLQLPKPPGEVKPSSQLVLEMKQLGDKYPSAFQVLQSTTVRRGNRGHVTSLDAYSSDTNCWRTLGPIQQTKLEAMVLCNNSLFCLNAAHFPHMLVISDVDFNVGRSLGLPVIRSSIQMLEWNGRVLVTGLRMYELVIWMLDPTTLTWTHINSKDPRKLGSDSTRFSSVICGDVLFFLGDQDCKYNLNLLTFDLHKKRWRYVRNCPFFERSRDKESIPSFWSCNPSISSLLGSL